jgi:hypothetical protein
MNKDIEQVNGYGPKEFEKAEGNSSPLDLLVNEINCPDGNPHEWGNTFVARERENTHRYGYMSICNNCGAGLYLASNTGNDLCRILQPGAFVVSH